MDENGQEIRGGVIEDVSIADLRFAKSPEDLAHIHRIEDVGVVLISEEAAGALTRMKIEDVGTIVHIPSGANVVCHTGQITMTAEALENAPEGDILIVAGQFFVNGIPKSVGYQEIRVIGQLMATRGSEGVLGPKLKEVRGQTIYLPQDARKVFSEETIDREYLEYLDGPVAFAVFGELTFDAKVETDLVRSKISELVVFGNVRAPRHLLSLLRVLAKEKYGEINEI